MFRPFMKTADAKGSAAGSPLTLRQLGRGVTARVARLAASEGECQRLREMGFCEQAIVRVLTPGAAVVCQICGARVCLSRQLADAIWVAPAAA